jgi:SAM-dependent methyltransferase
MNATALPPVQKSDAQFDRFATSYDEALQQGLAVSGESKEYFASGRIQFLKTCLDKLTFTPSLAFDFGCGTGTSVPLLHQLPGVKKVTGTDLSAESIAQAQQLHAHPDRQFVPLDDFKPAGDFDLAFCNGVFHHIPIAERAEAVATVFRSLKPGGIFAFWENNPWNPATRYVMSRIPFDKDAITLTPSESRTLLKQGGFEVLRTDYLFIFPKFLKWCRPLEAVISSWPLGTQYQVLCRIPAVT